MGKRGRFSHWKTGVLNVPINNAAISGERFVEAGNMAPKIKTKMATTIGIFREVYETNVFGAVRVTQAFLDLLKALDEPRIVMVSSTVGSLSLKSNPVWTAIDLGKYAAYGSLKSALNMFAVHLAYELWDTPFKIN